ncbi:PadR family transcriptional regulator [Demequina salsinemoris]|uniref:PadR family transcriptional regulator n=1 Tax=Demequina salsinemoris TaxID=577470 RepID=UPI00078281A8|nr:PadR family transcriptional regulator [Demequina salsinemoris]
MRAAILVLLAEQPRHGYDLIHEIEERSGGAWTPSPGSIYPTLQALEDEGLVAIATVDGRKTASLTDLGEAWVGEHGEEHARLFEVSAAEESAGALRGELRALHEAAIHVARVPGADLTPQVVEVLADARKRLYRLLADQD